VAIKFFNIRSKEIAVAETEPHIAAMWSSSDRSPNITQGQDFGWRMAPEVVVEMKKIKQNAETIREIAVTYGLLPESVGEPEILRYISDKTSAADAAIATEGDYTDEYDAEVRRLTREEAEKNFIPQGPVLTTQTTESLADMRERAELAERIAKAEGELADTANIAEGLN